MLTGPFGKCQDGWIEAKSFELYIMLFFIFFDIRLVVLGRRYIPVLHGIS